MDDQITEYFYSIVDQLPLEPGVDEDERDEVELMSFVGREEKAELFDRAILIVRDQIDPNEWPAVARRLKCRLYRDGEIILTCALGKDGRREGADAELSAVTTDDENVVAGVAAQVLTPELNPPSGEVQADAGRVLPSPKEPAHGFTKDELPDLYNELNRLLEDSHDEVDAELVLNKCNEVIANHEVEVQAWVLGAKALLRLDQVAEALAYVKTALVHDPADVHAHLRMFMVLTQLGRTDELALRINSAFTKIEAKDHATFAKFVAEAVKTNLVKRIELSVDVATAVLRAKSGK